VVYAAAMVHTGIKPAVKVTDRPTCVGNWCVNNYSRSYAGTVDLATALARSYNTIPVQLTTAIGKGNNKAGRVAVIEMARRLGLGDLRDMTSLPIGSTEVTVVDMASAFAVFANGGKRARAYAVIEVRNSQNALIYELPRPEVRNPQIIPASVAADMNYMLNKVTEEGTGRRALLPGIKTAGKTGTSDEYKNAWFVGYTGNYTSAVWFGNDDATPTSNMTGGSLPAQTWHDIMEYAHTDIDLKPMYGIDVEPAKPAGMAANVPVPKAKPGSADLQASVRNTRLSRKGAQAVQELETLFRNEVERQRSAEAPGPQGQPGTPQTPARRASFQPLTGAGTAVTRLN